MAYSDTSESALRTRGGGPLDWSGDLDDVQRSAACHEGGPLLVVAGAGTGKTRTLTARAAALIERGVSPERLLLLTFSRRASQEMIRRMAPLVGAEAARRVPAGTFHAVAHRILRRYAEACGLADGFSVLDQSDSADLMHLAAGSVHMPAKLVDRRFPRRETLLSCYSRVANAQQPLGEVLRRHYPWVQEHEESIGSVFVAYAERKRSRGLLDFDDLLLYWRAAAADGILGPALASAVDHVLVDEYQDTNLLQSDIVRSMVSFGAGLTAVGDDAQSIYSFRSARVANMHEFTDHFPGATVITLEQNYRSTQPVLDLANAVMSESEGGFEKRLWTANEGGARPELATCADEGVQAEAVADVVLEHHQSGVALREQAVLFRSAHHSDLLELELHRRGVPFVKYGGLRFLEASHVRDLICALRVLDNPMDDLAWYRLLQLLEGVGPATARSLIATFEASGGGMPGALELLRSGEPPLPRAEPARDAELVVRALSDCAASELEVTLQIERLTHGLGPLLRRRYDSAEVRMRDLDVIAELSSAYSTRAELVADLTLDPPSSSGDLAGPPHLDDDFLVLSTVHSAKGGEWRVVHLIHAADGMFPSDMATGTSEDIEEERRLFYVGLTRAKEHLHIYAPFRYHHGGAPGRRDRHGYAQRTRFLPPRFAALWEVRPVRSRQADLPLPDADAPRLVDGVQGALPRPLVALVLGGDVVSHHVHRRLEPGGFELGCLARHGLSQLGPAVGTGSPEPLCDRLGTARALEVQLGRFGVWHVLDGTGSEAEGRGTCRPRTPADLRLEFGGCCVLNDWGSLVGVAGEPETEPGLLAELVGTVVSVARVGGVVVSRLANSKLQPHAAGGGHRWRGRPRGGRDDRGQRP